MKLLILGSVLAFLAGVAAAQNAAESMWTGINGKSFRGTFHQLSEGGGKAEFLATDGRVLTVALSNLIPADRERILNPPSSLPANPAAPGDISLFKPTASPSRKLTPSLDPKTFDCPTDHSLVDALWISLLWWDQAGVLQVPKKGDLEIKAEWLHKKLTRAVVVVMRMSMQYANGRDYAVSSVLESMSEDGKFVFHVFGRRFAGSLKPMDEKKAGAPGSVPSEYVLDRPQDLPDFYATNEARFFMGMKNWNATVVLKSYVFLTPGKAVPLPADDE